MLASLEHCIPNAGGKPCKAQAGGLGKVMDLVARHHPTDILMIHPKLGELKGQYRRLSAEKFMVLPCVAFVWHFFGHVKTRARGT